MVVTRFSRTAIAAFLLTAGTLVQAGVVTDSVADFSTTQGEDGWFYGFYTAPFTSSSFQLLDHFDTGSGSWVQTADPRPYWTSLWSNGGHPNGQTTSSGRTPVEQWAVRRWVAPATGVYSLDGVLAKVAPGGVGGNGVTGHIFANGVQQSAQLIAGNDTVGVQYHLEMILASGSTIDFALDPNASHDLHDSSVFTAVIGFTSSVPEPSTLALVPLALLALCGLRRRRAI